MPASTTCSCSAWPAAAAIAFGFNTHANGLSPGLMWTPMMFGHLMVTAFWAGGLVALLLLVFPAGDPAADLAGGQPLSRTS